ncbi:uncharacterized protein DUF2613 [Lentzea atacamensis]|uniref:Uncharacterized protein DUF2613 n=1 Tax=Lentzea atacamensis TaxID=531938 RepID=A0ABX9EFE0_9PSEU|nr:DUF2613 family protein [Lentzea atacamensis]RAS69708.1 uncharacterized protein DUF2613 [Lentzea atacamensis]
MRTLIGAVIAVVAGLAFAGGGTYVLVSSLAPDEASQLKNAPAPNNSNPDTVNYGTP